MSSRLLRCVTCMSRFTSKGACSCFCSTSDWRFRSYGWVTTPLTMTSNAWHVTPTTLTNSWAHHLLWLHLMLLLVILLAYWRSSCWVRRWIPFWRVSAQWWVTTISSINTSSGDLDMRLRMSHWTAWRRSCTIWCRLSHTCCLARGSCLVCLHRRSLAEVWVFTIVWIRISVHCWCQAVLIVHKLVKFNEGNPLICIFIHPSNNGDDIWFAGIVVVTSTEIHDIAEVKVSFTTIIDALESAHCWPIDASTQSVLKAFYVNMVFNFKLKQISNLLLNLSTKILIRWTVVTWSLCDYRAHVQIVTGQ